MRETGQQGLKVFGIAGLLLFTPFLFAALVGIIPGLLLGIPGWHRPGGVLLGAIWAFGYLKQRGQSYGDVNWVTYPLSFGGGVGLVASIWFFGSLTE